MDNAKTKRIDYFDIAKGLAMFCVIAGHLGAPKVTAFVCCHDMPLFFLLSGYFFKNDGAKILRNTKKLLTAYAWTVIAVIVLSEVLPLAKVLLRGEDAFTMVKVAGKWLIAGLYGSGFRGDFLGFRLPSIGAIWFLLALSWGWGGGYSLSTRCKSCGNSRSSACYCSSWDGSRQSGHGSPFPFSQACVQRFSYS